MGCLILGCPFLDVPGTCVFSLLVVGLGVLTWGAQHTEGWGGRRRGASPHCTLSGPLPHLGGDAPLPSLWARGARLGEDSRSGGVLCRPPPPSMCVRLCAPHPGVRGEAAALRAGAGGAAAALCSPGAAGGPGSAAGAAGLAAPGAAAAAGEEAAAGGLGPAAAGAGAAGASLRLLPA